MTTRTKNALAALGIAALLVAAVIAVSAVAFGGDTATCHDGQTLSWIKVGGDTFTQGKPLPEGATVTDRVSGSGLDYTVASTKDSARLHVHGSGSSTFEVGCR